ncbi:hypothetical protein [Serinicoccus kebangsaanensis]|uniref:hypothetical protein n=1 Tax=Serinicoccus kebangsaanensis TaxID=2602069 RepID=UPI00124DECBB|nr:hypothetical protein [Serinicoccus kebangsaanensis]
MSSSVLACSPDELERTARLLREAGSEIEAVAGRLLSSSPTPDGWAGLAALQASARVQALHRVTRSAAGPPQEAAAAVQQCAGVARSAGEQVRRWHRVGERRLAESVALRAPGPPPEPALEALWRRRLEQLQHEIDTARRRVDAAEDDFRSAQETAARRVRTAWEVIQDLRSIRDIPSNALQAAGYAWSTVERGIRTTQVVVQLARARWARATAVRLQALHRAQQALARLGALGRWRHAPRLFSRIRLVPGPVGMVAAWFTAWSDLRDGGGYAGWRGGTTRVLAGLGLAGGVMVLTTPAFPLLGAAGVGLLTLYQAWSAGNAAYDGAVVALRYLRRYAVPRLRDLGQATLLAHRRAVGRLRSARDTVRLARVALALEAGRRMTQVRDATAPVLERLDDPVHRVVGLPPGGPVRLPTREVVDRVLGRLPDVGPLRHWWRQAGDPILMPVVPLPPGLGGPVRLGRWWP